MASNLKSAKKAIAAELMHAQKGIAYYTAQVQALEAALKQLDSVEEEAGATSKRTKPQVGAKNSKKTPAKRGRKPGGAANGKGAARHSSVEHVAKPSGSTAKRGPKPRMSATSEAEDLPSTGGDFWLNLVNEQPQSAVDISNAAIATLGIPLDRKQQIQKLKQRVSPALTSLVSAHKIKDAGSGRERRFFKNENLPA